MDNFYRYGGILYAALIVGLIAAKGAGHITWAWWIVLLPLSVPLGVIIIAALIMIIGLADATRRGENPFQ